MVLVLCFDGVMRSMLFWSLRLCLLGGFLVPFYGTFAQELRDTRGISFLEEETEFQREERELTQRRQRIERILSPEQKQREIEALQRDETNRQNRLARQKRDEVGADMFCHPKLKEDFLKDGWCQLFDGHTDFGWKIQTEGPYGGGKFSFDENGITNDPQFPGFVYTEMPFGNVNLRLDYWAEKDSEAFLLLKTAPNPGDLETSCYTFVLNSHQSNRPRGLLLGRHGLSMADLRVMSDSWDNPANNAEEGVWSSMRINSVGEELQVFMPQRPARTYFEKDQIPAGHIGLLVTKGKFRLQNILWQPSEPVPIFDTDAIPGEIPWRILVGSEFSGKDNTGFRLLVGSVETKKVYTNYVLQLQYRQGNNSGRSSLWVRSLPGQENTGYEISLQNFPRRQDREAHRGVDAGGFLDIMDARFVRPQDQQWTYLTVLAMDRRIQTWVNGVPVSLIYDQRSVRQNVPIDRKRDPFLGPGTIRFTVPADNSDFQFRRLMLSQ